MAGNDCSDDVSRDRLTRLEDLRLKGRVPSASYKHNGFQQEIIRRQKVMANLTRREFLKSSAAQSDGRITSPQEHYRNIHLRPRRKLPAKMELPPQASVL